MKTAYHFIRFGFIGMIIGLNCSESPQDAGIEIKNGNCVGTIYNKDNTAAAAARVQLIPFGYNPATSSSVRIDSTTTDRSGRYSFDVDTPGFYNIIAEKGDASCMQDSVPIQPEAQTIADDTLELSGRLVGRVTVKPGDDPRKVVILVCGTTIYTMPSDSIGDFTSHALPAGVFTVQLFYSGGDGYAVFDTLVPVMQGQTSELIVTLPSANAPSIAKLSAFYDSATMFVSLTWPMPDTSKIVSYALYRKTKIGNDTMVVIDKSATSYTDDVVGFDGDSVCYQIAAIGKNFKEGYHTATQPVIVCGEVYCVKEFDLSRITAGLTPLSYASFFSDRENGIFLYGGYGYSNSNGDFINMTIYKLDSNGGVRKEYHSIDQNQTRSFSGCLQSDDDGHLYIQKSLGDTQMVIKFDNDLNVIGQLPLDSGFGSILVGRNGTIYAFNGVSDSAEVNTEIKEYDSAFTVLKNFRIMNSEFINSTRFGDTIVAYDNRDRFIRFYDTAFTLLSVVKPDDGIQNVWGNPRFGSQSNFIAAPNGIFVSVFPYLDPRKESALLLFTDRNGKFLARIVVPALYGVSFDSRGNLCFLTYLYTTYEDAGFENRIKTLYKYTMEPLLRKIGN